MKKQINPKLLMAGLAILIGATIWLLASGSKAPDEKPAASNYYHGVVRNKRDPNIWGDDNGHQVPPPPDAIPYDPNARRDVSGITVGPTKSGGGGIK